MEIYLKMVFIKNYYVRYKKTTACHKNLYIDEIPLCYSVRVHICTDKHKHKF